MPIALSVVVPAYNEDARIAPTIRDTINHLRACGRTFEIVVVDDGSHDGTCSVINRMQEDAPELRLFRLAANAGKGYAVRTGVLNSRGARVLIMDADGATPISEVARLDRAMDEGADVAIGSRAVHRDDVTVRAKLYRRVMGRAFHLLVEGLAIRGIKDTQCGFKLFRGAIAHDLFARMRMNGFSFDVEVLLNAQLRGYLIAETPVNWEHKAGSRVNLVSDSMKMAMDLFVIRGYALRGDYDMPHVAALPQAGEGSAASRALLGGAAVPVR
jgi:dolichyl-phosphate beta-glucosyltransferase